MRTIVELPAEALSQLAEICGREGISRAEAVRRAVGAYVIAEGSGHVAEAFGIWRDRGVEGMVYEDKIRSEWAKPEARARRSRHQRRR